MPREILVAVVGLTPQVITETLYFLTQVERPPVALDRIEVITTRPGRELIEKTLLQPKAGQFHTFCWEYGIPPGKIRFDPTTLFVVPGPDGYPLDDLRTAADNVALADFLVAFIRDRTQDPDLRLYCSVAGGRKTMSVYLALALQLYGRPGDTLFHVLVSPEFESHPQFFYPPPRNRWLRTRDGLRLQTRDARVELARIPVPLLGQKLAVLKERRDLRYQELVELTQREVNLLRSPLPLLVDRIGRRLHIGDGEVPLTPLELAVYAWLAERRLEGCPRADCPGCPGCFIQAGEIEREAKDHLRAAVAELGARDERTRLLQAWTGFDRFSQVRSKINAKIQAALRGEAWHVFYVIDRRTFVQRGERSYGLPLDKGLITIQ